MQGTKWVPLTVRPNPRASHARHVFLRGLEEQGAWQDHPRAFCFAPGLQLVRQAPAHSRPPPPLTSRPAASRLGSEIGVHRPTSGGLLASQREHKLSFLKRGIAEIPQDAPSGPSRTIS